MSTLHEQALEWHVQRETWKNDLHVRSYYDWKSIEGFLDALYKLAITMPTSNRIYMEYHMQVISQLAAKGAGVKKIWDYIREIEQHPFLNLPEGF